MLSLLLIDVVVLSKLILLRIVVSPRLELLLYAAVVEDVLSSRLLLFLLSLMSFNLFTSLVDWRFFEGDAGAFEVSIGSASPPPPQLLLLSPCRFGIAMFRIFNSCLRSVNFKNLTVNFVFKQENCHLTSCFVHQSLQIYL